MNNNVTQHTGDCRDILPTLDSGSVHCCVTSPPYFGLRDYGKDGQIGLEPTPEEFVLEMVKVFREVRRVLRDDGTCWLNLGDSYASNPASGGVHKRTPTIDYKRPAGIKQKNLIGIPWRVAFALQADGWYLRQDIIWNKPNPMPESVRDRCTKAHEYIFLLSKSPRYYYDHEAIKEPSVCGHLQGNTSHKGAAAYADGDEHHRTKQGLVAYAKKVRDSAKKGSFSGKTETMADTGQNAFRAVTDLRNRRSVWTVSTQPYSGAHFAVFPEKLIEPCILAGCPEGGTVLDPFGGSGTTARVAVKNRRKAILIELNESYVELQNDRARNVQVSMF